MFLFPGQKVSKITKHRFGVNNKTPGVRSKETPQKEQRPKMVGNIKSLTQEFSALRTFW